MQTKDIGTNWKFVCKKDILQGWQKVAISLFGFGVLLGPPLDAIHSRVQLQIYDRGAIDVAGLHTNIWVSKYFSSHPSASTSAVNSAEWTPKRHALRWYWTMCSNMITTLGSVLKAIGRVLCSFKERENLHFDCSYILHVNSYSENWNDNLWKYLYSTFSWCGHCVAPGFPYARRFLQRGGSAAACSWQEPGSKRRPTESKPAESGLFIHVSVLIPETISHTPK